MVRRTSVPSVLGVALAWIVGGAPRLAGAAPAPGAPPPAPAPVPKAPPVSKSLSGQTFSKPELGLSVEGPAGWTPTVQSDQAPQWQALVSYVQPSPAGAGRAAQAALLVRRASAVTLARLRAEITKTYADDPSFTVTSIVDLPSNGRRPLSGLLVDATQSRAAEAAPAVAGAPAAPPPPPIVWRVQSAYFLGGEYEFLLRAQAPAAVFAAAQPLVAKMIDGFTLRKPGVTSGPQGDGAFRDDSAGFACRVPPGYGVRLPERTLHLVELAPAGAGPVLGVYRTDSALDLDAEAKALVDYYTGPEVNGEASASNLEIAGRPATLVTAKGRPPDVSRDTVFLVAIVKRGNDTFRIRASDDGTAETETRALFDRFVKGFVLSGSASVPAVREADANAGDAPDGEKPPGEADDPDGAPR